MRTPVAIALVKLLRLLPPEVESAELPRTLQVGFWVQGWQFKALAPPTRHWFTVLPLPPRLNLKSLLYQSHPESSFEAQPPIIPVLATPT